MSYTTIGILDARKYKKGKIDNHRNDTVRRLIKRVKFRHSTHLTIKFINEFAHFWIFFFAQSICLHSSEFTNSSSSLIIDTNLDFNFKINGSRHDCKYTTVKTMWADFPRLKRHVQVQVLYQTSE